MMMPSEFDEANKKRREHLFKSRSRTAQKLNARIKHFIKEVNGNYSLTGGLKKNIIEKIFKDIKL